MSRIALLAVCVGMLIAVPTHAEDDKDKTIAELRAKVAKLEARLAELEKQTAVVTDQQKSRRAAFNARMEADAKKYTPEQLREAESLYQTMNKDWRSESGKAALEKLVSKYPDINRTGCAYLYLGQVSTGEDKEKYLRLAIEKDGDCMYGDGVQVGAYARFLLASFLKAGGQADKAKPLFDEVKTQYADAVDHRGRLLVEHIATAE